MLQFENPIALIFLFLIPILYIFRKYGIFAKISIPLTISDWGGAAFSYKNPFSAFLSFFSEILANLGFVFLVVALANPIILHQEKLYTSRGTDILFVLDTSPSMAARDISLVGGVVTRLEAAKIAIKTLASAERGASYGLVGMASEAACIVPPTNDLDFFQKRLETLEIGEFGEGTALGIGLITALYHLEASKAPKKCIILITDGENNAGSVNPETAARLAGEKGISVYTFGLGTRGSVPIEFIDSKTGKIHSGFYESDFDSAPLEKLASLAQGKYFGVETLSELSGSLSEISRSEETVQSFYYKSFDQNCYRFFLLTSVVLLALAFFVKKILLSEVL